MIWRQLNILEKKYSDDSRWKNTSNKIFNKLIIKYINIGGNKTLKQFQNKNWKLFKVYQAKQITFAENMSGNYIETKT